ncbi:hypothetical protein [Nocardia sp. R6R-6]|uniref:hypothetical protein n=1 Tax=Nocardia sp. R6R-6 TaxID=3459303 RepID=UPI00403DAC10
MTTGGWFNHYDDPDEFWDDEPLEVNRRNPNHSPPSPRIISEPPQNVGPYPKSVGQHSRTVDSNLRPFDTGQSQSWNGSKFATLQVDSGLLPTRIQLSPQWHRYVDGNDAGRELMRAYQQAIGIYLGGTIKSGRFFGGEFRHECAVPDQRTILALLLETASWADYRETQMRIFGRKGFEVHGRVWIQNEPVTSINANRFKMNSIRIWPEWARQVDPAQIVDEIIFCADRVRELRPTFKIRGDYSSYSIEDLEYQHIRHRENLIEELGV